MNKIALYNTAHLLASIGIKKQFPNFPRPESFRAYFEHPSIEVDYISRTIKITVNLYASDDAPSKAIQTDLNKFIKTLTQGNFFTSELASFTVKQDSLVVHIPRLEQIFQTAKENLDDNYCDCNGFSVHYTHEIIFEITNDEAEKDFYEKIKNRIT